MRKQYKSNWNRPTSEELHAALRDEIKVWNDKILVAEKTDATITQSISMDMPAILGICQDMKKIESSITCARSTSKDLEKTVRGLWERLEDINLLQKRRQDLLTALEEAVAGDDIIPMLLDMVSKMNISSEGKLSEGIFDQVVAERMAELFEKSRTETRNLARMEEILFKKLEILDEQFVSLLKADVAAQSRHKTISFLLSGADAFNRLEKSIAEGMEFYRLLSTELERLRGKVIDFVYSREMDRKNRVQGLVSATAGVWDPSTPIKYL